MAIKVAREGKRLLLALDVPVGLVVAQRPERRHRRSARARGELAQHRVCSGSTEEEQLERTALAQPRRAQLRALGDKYLEKCIDFVVEGIEDKSTMTMVEPPRAVQTCTNIGLIQQLCNMLASQLTEARAITEPSVIEAAFVLCLSWSLGGPLTQDGRVQFHKFFAKISGLPPGGSDEVQCGQLPATLPTLHDYYLDLEQRKWMPWSTQVPSYEPPADGKFSSIMVPTSDTVRSTWLLDTVVTAKAAIIFIGESGTAKTTIIQKYLESRDPEAFTSLAQNFSTSLNFLWRRSRRREALRSATPIACSRLCELMSAAAEKDAAVREALRIGNEAIEAMQRKSLVEQKQAVQAERLKHEEVVRRLTERFTAVRVQAEQDRDAALAAAEAAEAKAAQAADEALKAAMGVVRQAQTETARETAVLLERSLADAEARHEDELAEARADERRLCQLELREALATATSAAEHAAEAAARVEERGATELTSAVSELRRQLEVAHRELVRGQGGR